MKPQLLEGGILRDPPRRQAKTKISLILPLKTYPKGGKDLGLADDGFPWDHYARPISGKGRDPAPLRPNRFTGRPSSSTAPPERSDAAPPGRSIGNGKRD